MAASERSAQCKYCGRRRMGFGDKFHNDGCPDPLFVARGNTMEFEVADQKRRMAEWEEGYQYGFEDNYIHPYSLKLHSSSFALGYGIGKERIDRLVEQAVERNYGYEYDE